MSFLDFEKELNQNSPTPTETPEPINKSGRAGGEAARTEVMEEETIADTDKPVTPKKRSNKR